MTTLTHEPATDGQIKQLVRMATDAAEKAVRDYAKTSFLNKQGAERAKGSPDFSERIRSETLIALSELSTADKYKDEEVESSYGYLSGYRRPKQILELVKEVGERFDLDPSKTFEYLTASRDVKLEQGAEGLFAIPNLWRPESALPGTYNDNVVRVLDLIKQDRDGAFYNYRDGQLGLERLRQSARTEAAMRKLSEEQGHPDILVIAAQFGLTHRGRSVRRAREVMVDHGQYGLGAFTIGVMILTHSKRLEHYDDLWIDCAGDKFDDPDAEGRFDRAPHFGFRSGWVGFDARWAGSTSDFYGSASGVLPQ